MDFIFTMDDGSQYLAHHGVKGMHWGEWNDETRKKYLGTSSPKGDKLRKKADQYLVKAERARTNTALLNKASQVNSDKITEAYAKANIHRQKAHDKEYRAKRLQQKADDKRREGDEKRAKKLERKSLKQQHKAQDEYAKSERESKKGTAASDLLSRENQARRELDAQALKYNTKASKLEQKAAKADMKHDKKVEKSAQALRVNARGDKSETALYNNASKYVSKTEGHGFARQMVDRYVSTTNTEAGRKRKAAIESVMKSALAEREAINKKGAEAVDLAIDKALGSKRGYRYL